MPEMNMIFQCSAVTSDSSIRASTSSPGFAVTAIFPHRVAVLNRETQQMRREFLKREKFTSRNIKQNNKALPAAAL